MGELSERCKLSLLVHGDGIIDNYQKNNNFFESKYLDSDNEVKNVRLNQVFPGRFYFFQLDDNEKSNWIRLSPTFVISNSIIANSLEDKEKKDKDLPAVIDLIHVINMNFLPFEVRVNFFDKFMLETNFRDDRELPVTFKGVYDELRTYGFEYAINQYPTHRILNAWRIHMELVPRFLYSSHRLNVYDPVKLHEIRKAKFADRAKRDAEMRSLLMSDFMSATSEINKKFETLSENILRVKNRIKGK
jgi:hypothetical protein